ncbi:MAG: PaaI family thioesterase [Acidimicrobiia bacterium]
MTDAPTSGEPEETHSESDIERSDESTDEAAATSELIPAVDDWEERTLESFGNQAVMATLGASFVEANPGTVTLSMAIEPQFSQQHGFMHAGIVATLLDSACGYAGYTLMPEGAGVVTVEYKINLLAPAKGELLVATGEVVRSGRSLTVVQGSAHAVAGDQHVHVAEMQATLMTITDRDDIVG